MEKTWKGITLAGDVRAVREHPDLGTHLDSRDEHGQTALMNAARLGHVELVRFLVNAGADLDRTAKYGLTALMLAIICWEREIAEILIRAGADLEPMGSGAPGFAGKTALDLARDRDFSDVIATIAEVRARTRG